MRPVGGIGKIAERIPSAPRPYPVAMATQPRRPGNLPAAVSSFVGRRRELADVRRLLTEARLVCLTGTGGVGKSRLALRVASDAARGFSDGVWLTELADVHDPAMVAQAVLAGLDLRDQAAATPLDLVSSWVRDKELLLVVDNCEHLLDGVAVVVNAVLAVAPSVRIIATSREPLAVPGEHVVPVAPLDLPPPATRTPQQLRHNEAIVLFAERAAAASGRFELTDANVCEVAELCRRLDGLPLAIELAAVRTRVLTVRQILERLADRFALLTGGGRAVVRHQALRTTMEWSHDLLDERERVLLRRLCVFAGRFTLADVESVCVPDALDVLSSLVDKSLVLAEDTHDATCYRLHETTREFARIKLRAAGETDDIEQRRVTYYLTTCRQFARDGRYRLVDCLEWTELRIDDIRSVLRRSVDRADAGLGLALAAGLSWYWITRATAEGSRWLDAVLALDGGDPAARVVAVYLRGFLAVLRSDPATARPALRRVAECARKTSQHRLLSEALSMASVAENMAGDHRAAHQLLEQARCIVAGIDDHGPVVTFHQARALAGLFDGDLATARSAATDGARMATAAGDLYGQEMMLMNLGTAGMMADDVDTAKPLFVQALGIAERLDDRVGQYYLLDAIGCHAAHTGDPALAARLMGAAETVRAGASADMIPTMAPLLTRARQKAIEASDTARFDAEFTAGQRMTRTEAIALALGRPRRPAGTDRNGSDLTPLGTREADVARLVAEGLSNKQIGARLFISQRTVDSHVRSILTKLGFTSRTQIATWISSAG